MDFFVVPTVTGRLLYVLVVMTHQRRQIVHFHITEAPTAAWTSQQVVNVYHVHHPHRSLQHDSPVPRAVEPPQTGKVIELPLLGGLHHRYARQAA